MGAVSHALGRMPRYVRWRLSTYREVSVGTAEAAFYTGKFPEAALIDHVHRTEGRVVSEMLSVLEPDDVVWDVGANNGFYACLLGDELADGEVVAFEPLERNVRRLDRNLSLSAVDATVREVALGDADRSVGFDPPTFTNTFRGVTSIVPDAAGDAVQVEMRTGDGLVANGDVPAPTVVKVDVEGAEGLVLDGMDRLLSGDCRAVFCELHPELLRKFGTSETEVLDVLASHGFEVRPIQKRANERHVMAVREG